MPAPSKPDPAAERHGLACTSLSVEAATFLIKWSVLRSTSCAFAMLHESKSMPFFCSSMAFAPLAALARQRNTIPYYFLAYASFLAFSRLLLVCFDVSQVFSLNAQLIHSPLFTLERYREAQISRCDWNCHRFQIPPEFRREQHSRRLRPVPGLQGAQAAPEGYLSQPLLA
ncbi:hypothetical protein [Massilia frigida]|uniref:hypothetical protein n=1 Tax=Massilia frigida TaxID=2609281 RepID=UPI00141E2DB8|nr:hypothetical protein [Massilia frigida]